MKVNIKRKKKGVTVTAPLEAPPALPPLSFSLHTKRDVSMGVGGSGVGGGGRGGGGGGRSTGSDEEEVTDARRYASTTALPSSHRRSLQRALHREATSDGQAGQCNCNRTRDSQRGYIIRTTQPGGGGGVAHLGQEQG